MYTIGSKTVLRLRGAVSILSCGIVLLALCGPVPAQSCSSGPDLDAATKNAIESAARRYLNMSAQGDVAGLKTNAIPAIAGNFGGIEQAVVAYKGELADGQPSISGTYLLDASQAKAALPRADFYCGIYNSPDRVGFSITNLPAGRYAVVIEQVNGKQPVTLTLVLQDLGGSWKLAGYYPRMDSAAGHDGQWYLSKAREFKAKGQLHNAWFYYLTAWDLMAPVNFMSTPQLDKLADEMQSARPADLPTKDSPMNLPAGGKVFKVIELVPVPVENSLDLRLRYQNSAASNSGLAFQDNIAVIKAIVAKYPEVRDAFGGVVARAVDDAGHDYGSMLPMKEIK